MKIKSNFKVIAPATLANLGCGFNSLAIALEALQDEIVVTTSDQPGIHITTIINNKPTISSETMQNAASVSAQLLLDHYKAEHNIDPDIGFNFKLTKKVPLGYGLGSSSASAVAGVIAVNEALGNLLEKRELLPFAIEGEKVAEGTARVNSIAAALLGGMMLTRDHTTLDIHRLPLFKGLSFVIIYPQRKRIFHKDANLNTPQQVTLEQAQQQAANASALVQALYTSNLTLLSNTLCDHLVEKQWSENIPFFQEIKTAALEHKALGCGIAGSGSGIFAVCKNSLEAAQIAEAMQAIYEQNKVKSKCIISNIHLEGGSKK